MAFRAYNAYNIAAQNKWKFDSDENTTLVVSSKSCLGLSFFVGTECNSALSAV